MYSLVGARAITENLVVLASADGTPPPRTLSELRTAFRRRMYSSRKGSPASMAALSAEPVGNGEREPRIVAGGDELRSLVHGFDLPRHSSDDVIPAPGWRVEKVVLGWRQLCMLDDTLGGLAEVVVDTVFVAGAGWTGSMSNNKHIGVLWLMPGREWRNEEVVEAFLHEITHTTLFLDERRYGHFLPAAADVRVRSAIRQDVREYPAVVHSTLVAAELLAWRERHSTPDIACRRLHGPTRELTARAQEAHAQIVAEDLRRGLLTPRMRELVEEAGERIRISAASSA
ncbi:hypothetical protein J7W19_26120 [Streptomyces mobaraensis NBRC 13819 = DSM 40847]|uniref:HEXXH motif domain-containing protein n=1 Tax=Streptomyces mobaraensis (strain ATCC 29032 / DSM 40847 / JCM 4168 / NBRC 13819 / NCIMB 11159 / IPCR 16-22) TaxID=1223523 RepID=M3AA35_STRM1|nr:HEXXH motif-containing putative peptide modification protein [Streptomyces mobaraensis]EMF02029.1 hypothetical protein H340_03369 [Streptomyces mobaraensis NBRC 13819 = DSM 40847]QTT76391.1 hypothetical protein J7W19_26120 [Streptomyces mobaraensis NBRC 13819 = DSM 40847]